MAPICSLLWVCVIDISFACATVSIVSFLGAEPKLMFGFVYFSLIRIGSVWKPRGTLPTKVDFASDV